MTLTVRSLYAALALLVLSLVAPATVHAVGAAERGARGCTIVGTPGPDRLVGTKRADVICGLGGDDTIFGRGGADRILGGTGNDVIRGGGGRDAVDGGEGADRLVGSAGDDVLVGGGGNDRLAGGNGRDRVQGDAGDDHLDGGPRPDVLDGGEGANTCVVNADDDATRCRYDVEAPTLLDLQLSASTVDVSLADRTVTIRARVADDTAVTAVHVYAIAPGRTSSYFAQGSRLVTGTVRDGWWASTVTIPQYAHPGAYSFRVAMSDRMRRWSELDHARGVTLGVTTSVPDTEGPALQSLLSPAPGLALDVREQAARFTVSAHLTDNLSGIGEARACATTATHYTPSPRCAELTLTSGTVRDGIWSGVIVVERGDYTDQWKMNLWFTDRANPHLPGQYYSHLDNHGPPTLPLVPAGSGVFQVLGGDPPPITRDPQVASVVVTPTLVDTLPRAASVSATVALDDPDGAAIGVWVGVHQTRPGGYTDVYYEGTLTRGADGLWRGHVVLPQGTPPGQYEVFVIPFKRDVGGRAHYTGTFVTVADSTAP